jgi:hypothetical protein
MKILSKNIAITLVLLLGALMTFGRDGVRLYSVVNNGAWFSASSWSLTPGGTAAGYVPQSDDTLIISKSVILNNNFSTSGNGQIKVISGGLLRGDSFTISLNATSGLHIEGEARLLSLIVNGSSVFTVAAGSSMKIMQQLSVFSDQPSWITGDLIVEGSIDCGGSNFCQASIAGTGFIKGAAYSGCGEIMNISPASSIIVNTVLSENNWIGSVSNDWNDPQNWSGQTVPTLMENVAITSFNGNIELSGNAFCNNLYLSTSSDLLLKAGSFLHVDNDVKIPEGAKFTMANSDTQKSALLVKGEVIGKIRSEYPVRPSVPMFVSSPVTDAKSGVFVNMFLRAYDESVSAWGQYIVPTDVDLDPMEGYELVSLYPCTRVFEGTPNNGVFNQPVSAGNHGWNLIGNPYPAYLDWKAESSVSGWQRNTIASAIYYPDPSGSGNYAAYVPGDDEMSVNNGSRYIPPMQGFFVKARNSGTVTVNTQAITQYPGTNNGELPLTALKFRIEGENYSDETVVRFNPSSSFTFDDDFDAYKIPGTGDAPSIYSVDIEGTQLAINTMPSLSSTLDIPFGVTCSSSTELKLVVEGSEQFEFRYPLMLEDRQTNTFIDLRTDSEYVFNHSILDDPMRFVLHFDVVSGTEEKNNSQPAIQYRDGSIVIKGIQDHQSLVEVTSLDGKQVLQTEAGSSSELMIPFSGHHGIYIIKVTAKTTSYAHKIFAD